MIILDVLKEDFSASMAAATSGGIQDTQPPPVRQR
jgi:hypothetical protein